MRGNGAKGRFAFQKGSRQFLLESAVETCCVQVRAGGALGGSKGGAKLKRPATLRKSRTLTPQYVVLWLKVLT